MLGREWLQSTAVGAEDEERVTGDGGFCNARGRPTTHTALPLRRCREAGEDKWEEEQRDVE